MKIRMLNRERIVGQRQQGDAFRSADIPVRSNIGRGSSLWKGRHQRAFGTRCGQECPRSGFTLVEMLLVLVILATLAAIVYPKVMGRSEQARITAAQTQIASFKTMLDSFEVDTG